jgi:hypothetical protein
MPFYITRTRNSTIKFPFFAKKDRGTFGSGEVAQNIQY